MNPIYKTHLTNDSIKAISRSFFDEYKDPSTDLIDAKCANVLIKNVYECMGIRNYATEGEGANLVKLFGEKGEFITYEDVETVFRRYLTDYNYVSRTNAEPKNMITREYLSSGNANPEKRNEFYRVYDTMVKKHGKEVVDRNLYDAESLFKKYDVNRDGYLDGSEIRNLVADTYGLINRQITLSNDDVNKYISFMDYDKDGRISEFDYDLYVLKSLYNRNMHL